MIISSKPFKMIGHKDLRIEIVDGDDIMLSYKNHKYASSCMSVGQKWRRTKFYSYVQGCQLIRIMRGDDLLLRSLLWTVKDGRKIIRYYESPYCCAPYDHEYIDAKQSIRGIATAFYDYCKKQGYISIWAGRNIEDFAFKVMPHKTRLYPSIDTVHYLSKDKSILRRKGVQGDYTVTDHNSGKLQPAYIWHL